jgi:S-adenosylmethionine hydrolase
MRPVIVLLTDFGTLDPYVGQMKGALLREAPDAQIVDLCHEVRAHNIAQAGFLLEASHIHFPPQAIFVGVVDPGVGSSRSILIAQFENQFFLAPNNGLLSFLIDRSVSWWKVAPKFEHASNTFHGRDIFAPIAARLALGASPRSMAERVPASQIACLAMIWAENAGGVLDCTVLHVDRFGNCLLNLRAANFPCMGRTWALDSGRTVREVTAYADLALGQIGLLAGSQGVMELALNQGDCARLLDLYPGQALCLTQKDDQHP